MGLPFFLQVPPFKFLKKQKKWNKVVAASSSSFFSWTFSFFGCLQAGNDVGYGDEEAGAGGEGSSECNKNFRNLRASVHASPPVIWQSMPENDSPRSTEQSHLFAKGERKKNLQRRRRKYKKKFKGMFFFLVVSFHFFLPLLFLLFRFLSFFSLPPVWWDCTINLFFSLSPKYIFTLRF